MYITHKPSMKFTMTNIRSSGESNTKYYNSVRHCQNLLRHTWDVLIVMKQQTDRHTDTHKHRNTQTRYNKLSHRCSQEKVTGGMPITLIFTLHRVDHNCIEVRELNLALHHTLKLHSQHSPGESKLQ